MKLEDSIAERFDIQARNELNLDVYNKLINFRHHTGKTSVPYGQGNLIAKQSMWSAWKALLEGERKADIYIRSHIHECCIIDLNYGVSITTPALQLPMADYGIKHNTYYTVGFITIDIEDNGYFDITKHIYKFKNESDGIIYES